ncbi:hypothetical protein ACOSP6_07140 [Tenacibaculum sp. MEBiC06402]|uniref:hypothetical protein n=1 Tax=unclassified Tenacibaculum TaxID=2635139 RepID=UPI003B9950C5
MLRLVNLQEELIKNRDKELKGKSVINWVNSLLKEVDNQHQRIEKTLKTSQSDGFINKFTIEKLDSERVFHISHIKNTCVQYRLKFLDTSFFKGDYPKETISKINELERNHGIQIQGYKIIAPSILFKLKKADDPLLFAPLGNNLYYLIDKWGNDINATRRIKYWPVRTFDNFAFTLLFTTVLLTALCHRLFFGENGTIAHFFIVFLFFLKGVIGMALFFGVSIGKNFTEYSWRSEHDKIR